ncbi:MAG: acyl carrier protein [Micromonosporaceae bacterium]|nr:acyl carrier protein [Micromonosporaceae bacterium]
MTGTIEARKEQVRDVVCEILEIEPDEVTEDSLFREDHGADSMAVVEVVAWLEKAFNVKIDNAELVRMVNLAGVYAVVTEAAGWESAS